MSTQHPHADFSVMIKPAGPACNLACGYCYYLDKQRLFNKVRTDMSYDTLETFIKNYIETSTGDEVSFTWHGGEALLRPIAFYQRAFDLQQKYSGGKKIVNSIQTNGTLINHQWCQFFKRHKCLIGISIDGPQSHHDLYRRNIAGRESHQSVMRGIRLLQFYGIEWNAMAVVNSFNADHPDEFYDFFKHIGCQYLQFTPIVERITADKRLASRDEGGTMTEFSVSPQQWGNFLCRIFDRWVSADIGELFIQLFETSLANLMGVAPGVCSMAPLCGRSLVIEHNGDVYSCDHFVFPEFRLGNIYTDNLADLANSPRQIEFGRQKYDSLPDQCRQCRFIGLCYGECPKNRFSLSSDGQVGLNYLCKGYYQFFEHALPYLEILSREIKAGRPALNILLPDSH